MDDHHNILKELLDVISVATVVGTIVNMLPSAAALFSIAWTLLRIYESKTVQGWLNKQPPKAEEQ